MSGKLKPIERRRHRHGKAHFVTRILATFFKRYGVTLEHVVAEAAQAEVVTAEMGDEGMMHLAVTMSAAVQDGGAVGAIGNCLRRRPTTRRWRPPMPSWLAGGPQQYPFVLVPDGFAVPEHTLLGPGAVHNWMRRRLAEVGQEAYDDERAALAR